MMSALRQADQIVLGHLMVGKSNENPAAPELIEALGLGCDNIRNARWRAALDFNLALEMLSLR